MHAEIVTTNSMPTRNVYMLTKLCTKLSKLQSSLCKLFVNCFIFSELTHIVADVISDPTLPRTEDHQCPECNHR